MKQSLLIDSEPVDIPEHHKFKQSWRWPHAIEYFFAMMISSLSLHVCCGRSSLGDIRLDIDRDSARTIAGDMRSLPFADNIFDWVFGDWPWKMNYFQRWRPFYEMVRVCKIGGRIIINATWIPFSKQAVLEELYVRCDGPFKLASVICVFRKVS